MVDASRRWTLLLALVALTGCTGRLPPARPLLPATSLLRRLPPTEDLASELEPMMAGFPGARSPENAADVARTPWPSDEQSVQLASHEWLSGTPIRGTELPADVSRLDRPAPTATSSYGEWLTLQLGEVRSDYEQFFDSSSLKWLAGGLIAGAAMANTSFDEDVLRDSYIENVVLAPSNEVYEILHQPKFLGDGNYTIPVFAAAALSEPLIGRWESGQTTAEWGQRSLRSLLVGGPVVLGLQWLTGGGRPDESDESSEWRPLQDDNGVSGHSFMGALPLISAAKMTDNLALKGGFYAASTLPALSRINDDAHYFSQAFLGWWLAYLAESAVDRSWNRHADRDWHLTPTPYGMAWTTKW